MLANAVKQEDFGKAHKIQTKMDNAMAQHQANWTIERKAIIKQKIDNLKEKQRREMATLDKRILATTTEMTELGESEIKRMEQQMNNKIMDCERQGESARLSRTCTSWGSPKSRGSMTMTAGDVVNLNKIDEPLESPTRIEDQEAQDEESKE